MRMMKRLLALLLVLLTVAALPVSAAEEADCIRELISYYYHHGGEARLDQELLLAELSRLDGAKAAAWEQIMGYWNWANTELDVQEEALTGELPRDDSLCIVVLGYQLTPDGKMRQELIGRLERALAAAEQYPNAYIACTGGPTAPEDKGATEAGKMAAWLERNGVARERLLVEEKSLSTLSNARYVCSMIYEGYPQIRQLAVITSDYHLRRSCVYFNTQAQLDALERGCKPLTVTGAAAYQTRRGDENDRKLQAEGLAELAGVTPPERKAPELSRLEHIQVSGPASFPVGQEPELRVRAVYTGGRSRDVTYAAKFSGFDLAKPGAQQITVTYREEDRLCTAVFDAELTEAMPSPESVPEATAVAPARQEPRPVTLNGWLLLPAGCGLLLIFRRKIKRAVVYISQFFRKN